MHVCVFAIDYLDIDELVNAQDATQPLLWTRAANATRNSCQPKIDWLYKSCFPQLSSINSSQLEGAPVVALPSGACFPCRAKHISDGCVSLWKGKSLPCYEAVDALVEEAHEAGEGLAGEISRLTLHIVQEIVLTLSPPLQGS